MPRSIHDPAGADPATPPARPLHPAHRLWRLLPAAARRRALGVVTRRLAPRPVRPAPAAQGGLVVAGELDRPSGLGESARLMLAALAELQMPAWGVALDAPLLAEAGASPAAFAPSAVAPPPGAPLLLHVNAPLLPLALLRLPRSLLVGRRIIGYWAWELPTLPREWRAGMKFVHEIWVPSRFTQAAIQTGFAGPVRCVPHPVGACPPMPSALDRTAFGLPADAVVTLVSFSLASSLVRKNPLGAIAAHRLAFHDRPDRILVLKITDPGHFPADFQMLRAAAGDAANIRFETRSLPQADSHALTRAADLVLSLHRAEGFGLVPAEAMLLGRAVIATNWSGNVDFMPPGSAGLVGYRLVPARDPRGVFEAPGAMWAEPDLADAAGWLTRLADDPAARAALAAAGQAAARQALGLGPVRAALRDIGLAA